MTKKFKVIRDSRERVGFWNFPEDSRCLGTEVGKLDTGDYSIAGLEDKLCIERKKTISEICNNMNEDRFTDELKRMEKFKYKYIILEFDLLTIDRFPLGSGIPKSVWGKVSYITPQYLRRYFCELSLDYGIHIIYGSNKIQSEKICYSLLKRVFDAKN